MGNYSKEHEVMVEQVSKKVNGEKVVVRGNNNIAGAYFPDVKFGGTDIECEIVPRKHYLLRKVMKWDKTRGKILVLGLQDFTHQNFDEIWLWDIKKGAIAFKIQ